MIHNPPHGMPRILVRLAYHDVAAAIDFLTRAFGFQERVSSRITTAEGVITLTEITVVDSVIMVGSSGAHEIYSPQKSGRPTAAVIVYIDGLDAHYERACREGAEILSPPTDMFWGDRRYEARDPEGHLWSFHEHLRDVSREEMDAAIRAWHKE